MKLQTALIVIFAFLLCFNSYADDNKNMIDAAWKGDIATVRALLAKGADVNAKDKRGWTALMWASEEGHLEIVQVLLAKGADVNAKDNNNTTALSYAAAMKRTKIVQLLTEAGRAGSGLYVLDAQIDFDTLDGVSYNPAQGALSLFGHRARPDKKADVHYLDLLAAALDSNNPKFSLEWTAASERDVDRALAYCTDNRNHEDFVTRIADSFNADGILNRKGAALFKAIGVDVREGMDRIDVNSKLVMASGDKHAGVVLGIFLRWVAALNRQDTAGAKSIFYDLADVLDLTDVFRGIAMRFQKGELTDDQLSDLTNQRLISELAQAFGWDGQPYLDKYQRLKNSGSSANDAGNAVFIDLQKDFDKLRSKALDAVVAKAGEVVITPDAMRDVLGIEPRVHPVLTGLPDHTRLALTACEADAFCKTLFDMPGLKKKVPRYQSYFLWLQERDQHAVAEDGHLWISPGDFELRESADGQTLRFGRAPMQFHIEKYEAGKRSVADPQLNDYADLLTSCYDDIAREYSVLQQLRECTKMVAVAQWLKRHNYTVSLPRAGRENVDLPVELPGAIYMSMAIKQGPVGEIIMATGGVDFSGDNGWKYTTDDTSFSPADLIDQTVRQVREKLEQISGQKIEVPMPRPAAEIKSEEIAGRQVTTVTIAADTGAPATLQLQHSPEQDAVLMWKADDLTGTEQALNKLIESSAADARRAASLRALRAQVLHEKGDDAAAVKELNEAVRLAPDLAIFKLLKAKNMAENDDLSGAETALCDYLKQDPSNQAAVRLLTDIQARQKGGAGARPVMFSMALDQAHTSDKETRQGIQPGGAVHSYPANCSKVDPNKTPPAAADLCPGGLVAMTYFCGGSTGCSYVCCPKGLPYLNHCDCKCYANKDFDCGSYSQCHQ